MNYEAERQQLQTRLDELNTPKKRNQLGQFATPYPLAEEILQMVKEWLGDKPVSFLEPAIGTGVFYSAFLSVFESEPDIAQGFEIDPLYGLPAKELWESSNLKIEIRDFLEALPPESKFDFLISNPPYSRHHHIDSEAKKLLQKKVRERAGVNISGLAGLYCYFMILSTAWLKPGALSCWLVPSEFLDVGYGMAVKHYLLKHVDLLRIHRFRPEDMQFSDATVTSSVVVFRNEKPTEQPVVFSSGNSLIKPSATKMIRKDRLEPSGKWGKHFSAKSQKIEKTTLGDYFTVKRGLATGNNDFFVIDEETIERYEIPSHCIFPLLPGPRYLKENIIYCDANGWPDLPHRKFLFNCVMPETEIKTSYPGMWEYISSGMEKNVQDGYICSRRKPWYSTEKREPAPLLVPYIGRQTAKGSTFRFILNYSDALTTNVFLMLYPKPVIAGYFKDEKTMRQIWEQLNCIPVEKFIHAGRVYGGGMHKLEPGELMQVPADSVADFFDIELEKQLSIFS